MDENNGSQGLVSSTHANIDSTMNEEPEPDFMKVADLPHSVEKSPNNTPPVPPTPKKFNHGLAYAFLGGVILLLVLVIGFLLSNDKNTPQTQATPATQPPQSLEPQPGLPPTPSPAIEPTSDWKVYSNTEVGYLFKYPADMQLDDYTEGINKGISLRLLGPEQVRPETELADGIVLRTLVLSNNISAEQHANELHQLESADVTVSDITPITFSDRPAFMFTIPDDNRGKTYKIYLVQLDNYVLKVWYFLGSPNTQSVSEYLALADQIVSTFEFTN